MLDRPFEGYQQARGYRLRQAPEEQGEPVSRMLPRSLMVPPGIPDFATRERTLEPGPCTRARPRLVGLRAGGARRGERRRRRELERRAARPATVALGVALMGVGLGARASPASTSSAAVPPTARATCSRSEAPWNLGGYANNEVQRVPVTVTERSPA